MNDEQLDHLIAQARTHYHAPPEPQLDELWQGIARRRRNTPSIQTANDTSWWRIAGVAAAVVISFALGRMSGTSVEAPQPAVAATQGTDAPTPVTSAATDLLGRTAVLLSALPAEAADPASDRRFAQQANELLSTTRLLLDSRAAEANPTLRSLLQDLELVLAQVARLRPGEPATERELITEALEQQDLVPRIRNVAAGLSAGDD